MNKKKNSFNSMGLKEVKINDLGDERIRLKKEISIILEIYNDEVIAHLVDAEVTGVGETETEALESIKENIASLYFELIEDENNLGPFPKMWLLVLRDIIECK